MPRFIPAILGLALASIGSMASGADRGVMRQTVVEAPAPLPRFFIQAGPAGLIYSESAKMRAGGVVIPGADVRIPNSVSVAASIGYHITPNFALALTAGYPPRVKVEAKGSINGLGTLGKVDGGPMALTAQYHFTGLGAFQPYIGVGPSLMVIFKDHDRAVRQLDTDHALGVAGQIGFNYMLSENWGVFFDVKKVYLRAKTQGTLGGVPIRATVTLDPLVLHSGLTYRF